MIHIFSNYEGKNEINAIINSIMLHITKRLISYPIAFPIHSSYTHHMLVIMSVAHITYSLLHHSISHRLSSHDTHIRVYAQTDEIQKYLAEWQAVMT